MYYQGKVIDNNDPQGRYRLKINIPEKHEENDGIWCEDILSRYNQGNLPEVDTMVWCAIDNRDSSLGFYFGYVKY